MGILAGLCVAWFPNKNNKRENNIIAFILIACN